MKNVLVGQSGGPTAVINSSLAGVYETAKACGAPHVYGMQYGIEGCLLYTSCSHFTWQAVFATMMEVVKSAKRS